MRGVTPARALALAYSLAFLLTRLMRGVTIVFCTIDKTEKFLLTRLMRGVTRARAGSSVAVSFLLTRLMRGVTTC